MTALKNRARRGTLPSPGIFARYTLRSLAANRVRTAVTVVGIALATGLLTAVLVSVTSLQAALYNQTRATGGVWQAEVFNVSDEELASLRGLAGDHLDRLSLMRDLGSVALSDDDAASLGTVLSVRSLPREQVGTARVAGDDEYPVVPMPELVEGRLPERAGEIALPASMRDHVLAEGPSEYAGIEPGISTDGPVEVGSTVTLRIGRRHALLDGATAYPLSAENGTTYDEAGNLAETIVGICEPRELTVVGFTSVTGVGSGAYVSYDEPAANGEDRTDAYLSTTGYAGLDELEALLEGVRPMAQAEDGIAYNRSLLSQQGLTDERAIWGSLETFAAVLAAVVTLAAISLISNAFVISVAERTRQFGLLSSLGASRRQLRRTVFVEAAVLGVAGIPLGVALGIAGAAAAFALTSEGWAAIVGTATEVGIVVEPWTILVTLALSAATLLLSALVPALRAGRVSAVDAIRLAHDVRPNRRLRRAFARRGGARGSLSADLRRPRGVAARLAGVPGFLARRTLAVSASKSRVAVLSLAVSVTLLMTSGFVNDYLSRAVSVIQYSGRYDLQVSSFGGDGSSPESSIVGAEGALEKIQGLSGVSSATFLGETYMLVGLDPSSIDADAINGWHEDFSAGKITGSSLDLGADGYGEARVLLVDDASWTALASSPEVGLSGAQASPHELSCVLIDSLNSNDGSTYAETSPFVAQQGASVDLLSLAPAEGYDEVSLVSWSSAADGEFGYSAVSYRSDGEELDNVELPVEDCVDRRVSVPVAAYASELGDDFPLGRLDLVSRAPTIVMPATAALEEGVTDLVPELSDIWTTYYIAPEKGVDRAAVLDEASEAIGSQRDDIVVTGGYDVGEALRQNRAILFTVQVFLYCFAAIMATIAVANVFNTIASGMMLRTREFAVLRSAGMGERSFRLMIGLECADYAARGLIGGVALSLVVEAALFMALSPSFSDLVFGLPLGYLLLSFAVVSGVLALSVVYALRKTHALNIVEALRADSL